jgi:hypothetical protein
MLHATARRASEGFTLPASRAASFAGQLQQDREMRASFCCSFRIARLQP